MLFILGEEQLDQSRIKSVQLGGVWSQLVMVQKCVSRISQYHLILPMDKGTFRVIFRQGEDVYNKKILKNAS